MNSQLTVFLTLILTTKFLFAEEESPAAVRKLLTPFMQFIVKEENKEIKKKDDLINLGRVLFYDKQLSLNNKYSCNSCHDLEKYGTGGDYFLELQEAGKLFRDVPSVYNISKLEHFGWATEYKKLSDKIAHSLTSSNEMNLKSEELVAKLKGIKGYQPLFQKAFPQDAETISLGNVSLAIQEFMNGLITPAPIDKFLLGDDNALNEKQLKGAVTFDKNNCFTCHTGATFGGQMIMKLGVLEDWHNQNDKGFYEVSKNPSHEMTFRVSPLRNVEKTAPYFHDYSSKRLWDAIGKMGRFEVGKQLSLEEIHHIQEFLKSLTGEIPQEYIKKPDFKELQIE